MSAKLEILSIDELIKRKKNFRIAFYQRGYRWRQQQILQLLNDLQGFVKTHKNPFYFLQALVVNDHADDSNGDKLDEYRVIDGQQRLTTLVLILQKMPQDWFSENNIVVINNDKMKYDRAGTEKNSSDSESGALDAHFRDEAIRLIVNYLENISKASGEKLRVNLLESKFLFYNLNCDSKKEEQIFNRLNSGKISAKESELIKCVMLTPQPDEDKQLTDARAQEWDDIERELNNDAFFYFMANKKTPYINDRMAHLLHIAGIVPEQSDNERFPMLKKAYEILQQNGSSKSREKLWKDIYSTFYTLKAWFTSKDSWRYHAFGWQIHKKGGELPENLNVYKEQISNLWKTYKEMSPDKKLDIFTEDKDKQLAHNLLLLFNVVYCWRYGLKYNFAEHAKIDTWSLEHIHAQNQEKLSEEDFNVLGSLKYEGKELKYDDYKAACPDDDPNGTIWLQTKLGDNYPADDNSLGNLALLSKTDNSSLSNGFFNAKRRKINNCWIGKWLPDATSAVFNKSLPGLDLNLPYWGKQDRDAYVEFIKTSIENFLEEKK